MYSGKDVPAVGVSIGVERVFTVLEGKLRAQALAANRSIRATKTQVLVGSFGKGLQVRTTVLLISWLHVSHAVLGMQSSGHTVVCFSFFRPYSGLYTTGCGSGAWNYD